MEQIEHATLLELASEATETWKNYLTHVSREYDVLLQEEAFWSSSTNQDYPPYYRWHILGNA